MRDGEGNAVTYWCKSQLAALERARQYVTGVGGVQEIHIQPAYRSKADDRKGA